MTRRSPCILVTTFCCLLALAEAPGHRPPPLLSQLASTTACAVSNETRIPRLRPNCVLGVHFEGRIERLRTGWLWVETGRTLGLSPDVVNRVVAQSVNAVLVAPSHARPNARDSRGLRCRAQAMRCARRWRGQRVCVASVLVRWAHHAAGEGATESAAGAQASQETIQEGRRETSQ